MRQRKLIVRLAAVALLAVLYWGIPAYKKLTGYPGQFLVDKGNWNVYRMDAAGVRKLGWGLIDSDGGHYVNQSSDYMGGFASCAITRSPDGRSAAYLEVVSYPQRRVEAIVTRPVGWPNKLGLRYDDVLVSGPSALDKHERLSRSVHSTDLAKYEIPYNTQANLVWSPDGKYLAFATGTTLYVVDAATCKAYSAKLPFDDALSVLCRSSREFMRDFQTGESSPLGGQLPYPDRKPELFFKPGDAPMRKLKPHQDKLRKIMLESTRSFAAALNMDPSEFSTDAIPYAVDEVYVIGGRDYWGLRFTADGRTLTWSSQNTLYCDNWKLQIRVDGSGVKIVSATKTKVPSAACARPLWNQQGDKAAFLVEVLNPKIKCVSPRVIVVDPDGKPIWYANLGIRVHCQGLRWSRDGKYIAVLQLTSPGKLEFRVFEVGTSRSWSVPPPPDDNGVGHIVAGWDWRK